MNVDLLVYMRVLVGSFVEDVPQCLVDGGGQLASPSGNEAGSWQTHKLMYLSCHDQFWHIWRAYDRRGWKQDMLVLPVSPANDWLDGEGC